MDTLLHKLGSTIKGCISGFDRIVFKGYIRPIMFATGMQNFLSFHGVLNKHYKDWVMAQSAAIVDSANQYSLDACGREITYISSSNDRKEKIAHEHQERLNIESGLIGVWACVEACSTFRSTYDKQLGIPQLRFDRSRCKHLYFYYDHADYGFMSVRLQTWAPFEIQIALNGREWLRRSLQREQCEYFVHGNKFLHIDDYDLAQRLLDRQMDTRWEELLCGFLPNVFPTMANTLGNGLSYYWTLWQSEWATDYIFDSPQTLKPLMEGFLRHALLTGTSDRVLRYMGRPVTKQGQPHHAAKPELFTRVNRWDDGVRIRHWVDQNSVKLYNEHNNLRFETTINNPAKFRVYRHQEGQKATSSKKLMPMRKGIADIAVRAQVAANVNQSFAQQMDTMTDQTPMRDLVSDIVKPSVKQGRKTRALDITGKDRELLLAIADPKYNVSSITNKAMREQLKSLPWAKGMSDKQLAARITRNLRLLRDHGLIRKLPNQRKYALTEKGRKITTALNVILDANTEILLGKAA